MRNIKIGRKQIHALHFQTISPLYVSVMMIMCIMSAIGTYYDIAAIILGGLEILVLCYFVIKGDIKKYLMTLLFVYSSMIENAIFVRGATNAPLYSFFNLPYIRGYHIYILQFLPLIFLLKNISILKFWRVLNAKYRYMAIFFIGICSITIIGIFTTLICLSTGDNGGFNNAAIILFSRRELLQYGGINLLFIYIIYSLVEYEDFFKILVKLIHSILVGLALTTICTVLLGLKGNYGTDNVQLVSLASFFSITLIIFSFYKEYGNLWDFILGLVVFIITVKVPNGYAGKWWLYAGLLFLIAMRLLFYRITKIKLGCILILIFLFLGTLGTSNFLGGDSFSLSSSYDQFSSGKLYQAKSMLSFWKKDWYKNMASSPKFRFEEFANVWLEYTKKPQFLIFGKGFGGSIQKHWGDLNWDIKNVGSFSEIEQVSGTYIRLHASFNVFFIKYGLLGFTFLLYICWICVKNFKRNPFLIPGVVWLGVLFGASDALFLGQISLVLGLFLIDRTKRNFFPLSIDEIEKLQTNKRMEGAECEKSTGC